MKMMTRLFPVIVFVFVLISGTAMAARPKSPPEPPEPVEVSFSRETGGFGFSWKYDDVEVIYETAVVDIGDLFGFATKDLAPGMETTVTLKLLNPEGRAYSIYLTTNQSLSERLPKGLKQEELEQVIEDFFSSKREEKSLLDEIDIVVTYIGANRYEVGREIYSGKLNGKPAGRSSSQLFTRDGVLLGNLSPSETATVTVRIHIPEDLDSSYMNTLCSINWQFTAVEYIYNPTTPTQGSDNNTDLTLLDPPLAEIEVIPGMEGDGTIVDDNGVPLEEEPDVIIVVTPGGGLPQTGGIKTFVIPLTIVLLLLIALLVWTYKIRRDEKERETVE